MSKRFSFTAILFVLFAAASAFAWPNCKGNWIQVPSGTSSANGAIYSTGDGLTFQCQTTPPPSTTPSNSTSSSNSSSSSASNSSSTSGSKSTSTSGVNNSGNSSSSSGVKNSGNSSSTSAGGAGGDANSNQQQTQNAQNSGNNSSYSNQTDIAAPKIPVDTAYAPMPGVTTPCFKGFGAGVQLQAVGASFGGGKIDPNCAALEAARQAPSKLARCKVYISVKYVKAAGVTLNDCMNGGLAEPTPIVVQPPSPVTMIVGQNAPVAAIAPPVVPEYKTEVTVAPVADRLLGICTFAKPNTCQTDNNPAITTVSSICKQMLEAAKLALKADPKTVLYVIANRNQNEELVVATSRGNNVRKYLEDSGVNMSRIKVELGTGTSRTVELWAGPKEQ